MRLHGESASELAGCMQAIDATLAWRLPPQALPAGRPLWCLPAYNGARKLLNATPLLAHALRSRGAIVFVHGVRHDPGRLTTAEIWSALGWPVAHDAARAAAALASDGVVFAPIDALHPRLARLLDTRWRIGVRSAPHTLAKLLAPTDAAWRAVPVTHADYLDRLARHLQATGGCGVVYRGCEGEAHWHPRRELRVHVCHGGAIDIRTWSDGAPADAHETVELQTTLREIEAVLAGHAALPAAIEAQADLMMETVHAAP
jgi:anthranilate phosphoribosyltransferase